MFNRQPFNRGKFNRAFVNYVDLQGDVSIHTASSGEMDVVRGSTFSGTANIAITSKASIKRIRSFGGNTNIGVSTSGSMGVQKDLNGKAYIHIHAASAGYRKNMQMKGTASILLTGSGEFIPFRSEWITLSDIAFFPGSELIIDTDAMTVKLNGQDITRFVSADSEFFELNPFENELIYEGSNSQDKVDIRIYWKDRFL